MKNLVLFLTITFACAPQYYAQNRTDRETENLLGPVHTVRLERAIIKCESGTCIEGRKGKAGFVTYDLQGNLIASNRHRFDPNNPDERLLRYPFGEESTFITKINVEPDGTLTDTRIYSFNNQSRQSERTIFRLDGAMEQREVCSFNFEGRMAEQTTYDADMQVWSRTTYTYDNKGNEIEQASYDKDSSITIVSLFEYEFDEIGNWTKMIRTIKSRKNGKLKVDGIVVSYRTITYH